MRISCLSAISVITKYVTFLAVDCLKSQKESGCANSAKNKNKVNVKGGDAGEEGSEEEQVTKRTKRGGEEEIKIRTRELEDLCLTMKMKNQK